MMNPQLQQQQYSRQFPQQAVQSRPPANARRPGQNPVEAQRYAQQQAQLQAAQASHRTALLEHQLAQRRAKKPTDKNMPDGVEDMIIGDGVQQYKELREQERRLDYAMMRKRLDMQETASRSHRRPKTLRLFITNTCENQTWQNPPQDFSAAAQHGLAKIRVEGRLLDDDDDDELTLSDDETPSTTKRPARKMSSFFKSMSVEFDKVHNTVQDPKWNVDWKKQPNNEVDAIEFKRKCEGNTNINLVFVRDEQPEKYRLSPVLAQTLDMDEADRAEVVMALWDYIRCMNLQEDEEKRSVRCDAQLQKIFNREQIYFPQLPDLITPHLTPQPAVKLAYTVRVDQAFHEQSPPQATIYDITVNTDSPMRTRLVAMSQNPQTANNLKQIVQYDEQLSVVVSALQTSKARHDFFRGLAKDPISFINKWTGSQRRDLEVILGEAGRGGGEDGAGSEFARGGEDGVWGSEIVQEAVRYMLAKPVQKA